MNDIVTPALETHGDTVFVAELIRRAAGEAPSSRRG